MKARSRSVKAVRRSLMYLPIFAWCTNDNEVSEVFADTVIIIEFLTLFIGWLPPSPLGFHGDCTRRRRVSDLVQPTLRRGKPDNRDARFQTELLSAPHFIGLHGLGGQRQARCDFLCSKALGGIFQNA